jgi:hypothetical protein
MPAIISLLNVLGGILSARGHSDLGEFAKLAASLVREGDDAHAELVALTVEMQKMVDEDRDPSTLEVNAASARRQELSDAIQAGAGDGNDEED